MSLEVRRQWPLNPLIAVALVVALVVLVACGGEDGSGGEDGGPAGTVTDAADPGIGHVHGLGVDPADGAVYVAAHFGLFKITGKDRAVRVADRIQDMMGFTVIGPKTFLASGHPAMTEMNRGSAPHLGLIRSSDAGRTWATISESGRADFHVLQPAGEALYAYDSQTGGLRRSTDQGRSWTEKASLPLADLAAHRDRPEQVYATTERGVQVSDDGGDALSRVPAAPVLVHLDAVDGGNLLGTGPDGQVWSGRTGGGAWQALGKIPGGQATAFTAVNAKRLLAATEDGTVHESRDGGRTFNTVFRPAAG